MKKVVQDRYDPVLTLYRNESSETSFVIKLPAFNKEDRLAIENASAIVRFLSRTFRSSPQNGSVIYDQSYGGKVDVSPALSSFLAAFENGLLNPEGNIAYKGFQYRHKNMSIPDALYLIRVLHKFNGKFRRILPRKDCWSISSLRSYVNSLLEITKEKDAYRWICKLTKEVFRELTNPLRPFPSMYIKHCRNNFKCTNDIGLLKVMGFMPIVPVASKAFDVIKNNIDIETKNKFEFLSLNDSEDYDKFDAIEASIALILPLVNPEDPQKTDLRKEPMDTSNLPTIEYFKVKYPISEKVNQVYGLKQALSDKRLDKQTKAKVRKAYFARRRDMLNVKVSEFCDRTGKTVNRIDELDNKVVKIVKDILSVSDKDISRANIRRNIRLGFHQPKPKAAPGGSDGDSESDRNRESKAEDESVSAHEEPSSQEEPTKLEGKKKPKGFFSRGKK
jgi:hypothetical protein